LDQRYRVREVVFYRQQIESVLARTRASGQRFEVHPNQERLVLSVEALFLVAFALWAFVRANNPDTTGTEKPMEIAFINAILRSPTFPPHDPWLSGYAISYYYFGYVLASMLAMFTATNGGMTFNLMLSLVFGLSIIGSYGLLYNLLNAYWKTTDEGRQTTSVVRGLWSALGAFFAPLFLLILSNVEGFLELLHSYGIGWTGAPGDFNFWTYLQGLSFKDPTAYNFWTWLKMKDLSDVPSLSSGWSPRFWFWWRASRILHDYDLRGEFVEIIDEFPFFSYLLGDLHPHVLAMPFGLLAVALALNLYLGGWKGETNFYLFKLPVRKEGFAVLAVVLGGLAFLNTWDFPIYLAVVTGAFILSLVFERGWDWELVEDFLKFSIPVAIASILLYLPFYVSFSSQAGGILPNVIFPTRET
jgi:YYY domain-containing protein